MITRGRPKIRYLDFDTYTFAGELCPCPTSSCSHRSTISLCGRAGGARLHQNASNILICVDIAIPAGESEKGSSKEGREKKIEGKWATMIENYEKAKKGEETEEESDGSGAGSDAGVGMELNLPGAKFGHQGGRV